MTPEAVLLQLTIKHHLVELPQLGDGESVAEETGRIDGFGKPASEVGNCQSDYLGVVESQVQGSVGIEEDRVNRHATFRQRCSMRNR